MKKSHQKPIKYKPYIMMNGDGEFFAGFMYGMFVWTSDIKEAKQLEDDGHKFEMMKMLWYRKDMIMEYV